MQNKKIATLLIAFLISTSSFAELSHWEKNAAPWIGGTLNGMPCNGGAQGYGPYDYTKRAGLDPKHLYLVESTHFHPYIEALLRGHTSETPEGDINYTLRAWPNHHRALRSIIRYQLDLNSGIRKDTLKTPPECYLQRALHFSPQDSVSYALYGLYLKKLGKLKNADQYYKKSLEINPKNKKISYSYALLLIKLKEYNKAVELTKSFHKKDKRHSILKKKLVKLGVWKNSVTSEK